MWYRNGSTLLRYEVLYNLETNLLQARTQTCRIISIVRDIARTYQGPDLYS